MRAGTISDQALKKIKAVDKVRKEQRKQTVEGNYDGYKSLLLGGQTEQSVLEAASKRQDMVQYLLVLTGDLLNGEYTLRLPIQLFVYRNMWLTTVSPDVSDFSNQLLQHPDPYKPFLPLLNYSSNPEDSIPLLASSVISSLIGTAVQKFPKSNPKQDEALTKLYKYLSGLTKSLDSGLQDIAVQEYSNVVRTKKSRELFWNLRKETMAPLFDILRTAVGATKDGDSTLWSGAGSVRSMGSGLSEGVGVQLLYHVLRVVWQLSFSGSLIGEGLEEYVPLSLPHQRTSDHPTNTPAETKKSSHSTPTSSASPPKKKQPASSSPRS